MTLSQQIIYLAAVMCTVDVYAMLWTSGSQRFSPQGPLYHSQTDTERLPLMA